MYSRRSASVKYFVAGLVLVAFYCEWFVFIIQPFFWSDLKCRDNEFCSNSTKILFVADPQIQGELAAPSPLNHLFIFDSDKYLKRTYSVVVNHFKPDVVVYLGDIMDEGSVATTDQYQRYVKRIRTIFTETYNPFAEAWVPGDNDIGGEMEPIRKDKIEAFEREFQDSSAISWNNIVFHKVNAITNTFTKVTYNSTDSYNIVISHYPVTFKYGLRNQVLNEIHPNIFFCAHSHESKYMRNSKDLSQRTTYKLLPERTLKIISKDKLYDEKVQVVPEDESLYEIFVPTCSYRMGTSKIGFGAAIYDHKTRSLEYTVFWSPQRFQYLFLYLALLIIILIYALVLFVYYIVARCWIRHGTNKLLATRNNSIPLLKKSKSFSFPGDSKNC